MNRVAMSLGALGLASGCWAQQLELSVRVSADGGATWSRNGEVARGQFAMGASFMSLW